MALHTHSKAKAKKILRDGSVRGKALTKKQKGFFGARAGGATPTRVQEAKDGFRAAFRSKK